MNRVIDRRSEILSEARAMLGVRGFNGFSHRDLARKVNVKSSSVHYHFPTKQDIGLGLLRDYRDNFVSFFVSLENLPVLERLGQFADQFVVRAEAGHELCLAGMLSSDFDSLEEPLRNELRAFFKTVEAWLAKQAGELAPDLSEADALNRGKMALALLEGALLLARSQEEPERSRQAAKLLPIVLAGT